MIRNKGFTLIELMVVVAIIGILASIAMPQYQTYIQRSEMADPISMATFVRENVTGYYLENLSFPETNSEANIPDMDKLIGNRVTGIEVENGAFHITMGNYASAALQGKVLTFRPAVVTDSPTSPISWLCGYVEPVTGMEAVGENRTDVDESFLPSACRAR